MSGLLERSFMKLESKPGRWKQTGFLIKQYRDARKLTQAEVASRIRKNVDADSKVAKTDVQLSRIESGVSGTSPETIDAIIAALYDLTEAEKTALYKASRYMDDSLIDAKNKEAEFQSAAAAYSATTSQRVLTLGTDSDAAALTQNGETVLVKMPEEQLQVLKDFNANFANFAKMMKQDQ